MLSTQELLSREIILILIYLLIFELFSCGSAPNLRSFILTASTISEATVSKSSDAYGRYNHFFKTGCWTEFL